MPSLSVKAQCPINNQTWKGIKMKSSLWIGVHKLDFNRQYPKVKLFLESKVETAQTVTAFCWYNEAPLNQLKLPFLNRKSMDLLGLSKCRNWLKSAGLFSSFNVKWSELRKNTSAKKSHLFSRRMCKLFLRFYQ